MKAISEEVENNKTSHSAKSRRSAHRGTETILLVEKETSSRERLASALAEYGYSVFTAADGVEAVGLFRSFEQYVDLVIVDHTLPRLTGFEAAVTIRNINPDVRIILMAGENAAQLTDEMHEWGIAEILTKPLTMKSAMKTIRRVLDNAATGE